jgi:hypothetical protein
MSTPPPVQPAPAPPAGDGGALATRLLELSRQAHAAAGAGDWEHVLAALDQRAPLVAAVAALDPATLVPEARATLRAALTASLRLDEQVQAEGRAARQTLVAALAGLRHGRQALRAYVSSDGAPPSQFLDSSG